MNFLEVKTLKRYRSLVGGLAILVMAGASSLMMPSDRVVAGTTKFFCGTYNGELATIAKTKKGDVAIVIWNSERFSAAGFTPEVRCKQVSARFETLYRNGQLKHITAGKLNKMPAICATKEAGSDCSRENLLYTLKTTEDPYSRLMMLRNREITSRAMEKSGQKFADTDSSSMPVAQGSRNESIALNWLEDE